MDIIEDDLDISWTQEYDKEMHMDENLHREPMNQIKTLFVYIDKDSSIYKVVSENMQLENVKEDKKGIPNNKVLQIVQQKKLFENKKYKLIDILSYCVDIEAENIQKYTNQIKEDITIPLKVLNIFNDVTIPDSIFIFHSINTLYFIFKEKDDNLKMPKSILKMHSKTKKMDSVEDGPVSKKTYTKKVSFSKEINDPHVEYSNNHHTRKNRPDIINIVK